MDELVCHNTEKDLIRLAFKVAPNEIGITSPKTKQIEAITLLFTHYCHKHIFFVTSATALIPIQNKGNKPLPLQTDKHQACAPATLYAVFCILHTSNTTLYLQGNRNQ